MIADGEKVAIIGVGPVVNRAAEAAAEYKKKNGTGPAVYNIRYIKPLDTKMMERILSEFRSIITIEDGSLAGGVYGAVCEYAAEKGKMTRIRGIGIPDRFISQGTQQELREECGLSKENIRRSIEEEMTDDFKK